ncbi:MAG TPA: glycosyltransferase [Acidobacteriaceae bacterium]|nr:glycosyltransferase [Acidobacteriaceae bacterium]
MEILWSVVITTRNRAEMLGRAIQSCIAQTVPCQIVVIDEASEDNTPDVVRGIPGLVYIRHERALGHSAAANRGIKEANGNWIKPLDDDDWIAPDCLEKMAAAIQAAQARGLNPVIASGAIVSVDEQGREIGRSRPAATSPIVLKSRDALELMLIDQAPLGQPVQVAHSRNVALLVGGWNENRPFSHQQGDEVEFWIKLVANGDCLFIPDYIAYRTDWPGNTAKHVSPEDRFLSNIYLKALISSRLNRKTPESVSAYLALHWSLVALKGRRYSESLRLALKWLRRPWSAVHLIQRKASKKCLQLAIPLCEDVLHVSDSFEKF